MGLRRLFPEYHTHNEADLDEIWNHATIVLDTSVLLNLYRLPNAEREDALAVLAAYHGHLWIPYHVALEYQRNRVSVAMEQNKAASTKAADAQRHIRTLRQTFVALRRRHPTMEVDEILTSIDDLGGRIAGQLARTQRPHHEPLVADPIRDELDTLLAGRVGNPPTADWVANVVKEGRNRYEAKIPPGYEDDNKADSFGHRGIQYPAKYGDLFVWKQILDKTESSDEVGSLIFVTEDRKADWWAPDPENSSLQLGARPELVSEIAETGGCQLLMITFAQFVRWGSRRANVQISTDPVDQGSGARFTLEAAIDRLQYTHSDQFQPPFEDLRATGAYPPLSGTNMITSTSQGVDVVALRNETEGEIKDLIVKAAERAELHNKSVAASGRGHNVEGRVAAIAVVLPDLTHVNQIYEHLQNLVIGSFEDSIVMQRDGFASRSPALCLSLFVWAKFNGDPMSTLSLVGHAKHLPAR